eukprot:1145947-Pelagomonas_calceolata.AAC.3
MPYGARGVEIKMVYIVLHELVYIVLRDLVLIGPLAHCMLDDAAAARAVATGLASFFDSHIISVLMPKMR